MSIKTNIKKWLITKLAGDTLVILNATLLYRYYPLYADLENNPIFDNNRVIHTETETPFLVYDNSIMEEVKGELRIKEKYIDNYNKAINEIQENLAKDKEEKPDA